MAQIYKIYINQGVLILTEFIPQGIENYQQIDKEGFTFSSFYRQANSTSEADTYLILTTNAKRLFKQIKSSLYIIKAAGGLVRNEENKYLFIFRKGTWDLPKGKIDENEKTKKAAVREVEEECGIHITAVGKKIGKTYHVYHSGEKIILKQTTWYHMRADHQSAPVPQLEEGITKAEWLAPGDFIQVKQNTFPLILELISIAEG